MLENTSGYKTPQLEYDQQGYVKSFDLETANIEQLANFYHKYGILVFRNILNQQQINKTIDDLWDNTITYYKERRNKNIDRNNPQTWNHLRGFQKAFGFVNDGILQQPQIWQNRRNPKVYKAFKKGYQAYLRKPLEQPLIACFDRGSLMLPSKLNPDWVTSKIYHFDIDPWSWTGLTEDRHTKYDYDPDRMQMLLGQGNYDPFVGYTKLAGVLALSDTNETSGGFECACGFQNYIKKWCQQHQAYTHIEQDKNLVENFRKIFVRKGSLMIFSRELPHNIYQNNSQNFRYAQYLRMSPLSAFCLTPQLLQARKQLVRLIIPKNMDLSDPISKQVFMLDEDWQKKIPQKKTINKQKNTNKKNSQIKQLYKKPKKVQQPAQNNQKNNTKSKCSMQ